jgi:predicted type IV restriction endonuclease
MPDFTDAKRRVARLVERFRLNPPTSEVATRIEFINPFFEALGWDVSNRAGYAEQYKEVVHEDTVVVGVATKAPDYAFRIGGIRKFFVEAKKPSVSVKGAPHPAYQLRRYAWSAKLPLSILTDFEEFAVYDCTKRPAQTDKASRARILYCTLDEYADRLRDIWDLFARESILRGSFERFAEKARGTAEVDVEFLREIEGWRDILARNIALRNKKLDIDQLNEAVQRIIDRIVFLRMAEDRGIERQGRLLALVNGPGVYARFAKLCRDADTKYNSGLFDFDADTWTLGLKVDDKVLKPIVRGVYYPESPYEFSVIPPEILGNVYEQFLGKVIRLTPGHQARVEEKPEVKKAGGVYYTPRYIVDYIVRHTIGELIDGKGPRRLNNFHVVDPACGSGSFLLGAYQYLLDHYLKWYTEHNPERRPKSVYRRTPDEWALTTAERKRILTDHIYGVDIDRQAVEVTKLSLLLKVLEGETADSLGRQMQLFRDRALPNLSANIQCGNSLIGPDYFGGRLNGTVDADELRRVNPFDWPAAFPHVLGPRVPKKRRGFDAVIGNPPYVRVQAMKQWAPEAVAFYKTAYASAAKGNYDLYVVFIERGLQLLNEHGLFGYICPHKFMNAKYGEGIRRIITEGRHVTRLVHFGDAQVFDGATTYTCLLFLSRAPAERYQEVNVVDLAVWSAAQAQEGSNGTSAGANPLSRLINEVRDEEAPYGEPPAELKNGAEERGRPTSRLGPSPWNRSGGRGAALFRRLSESPVKLGDVAERIAQGIRTSANEVYVLSSVSDQGDCVAARSKQLDRDVTLERSAIAHFLRGRDIKRYALRPSGRVVVMPYRLQEGRAFLIPEPELERECPRALDYLRESKSLLQARESGRFRGPAWYQYGRAQNIDLMLSPKILVPDIADRASFAFDADGRYAFTSGYGIVLKDGVRESPKYVLGLLNSSLLDFYLKRVSTTLRGGYFRYFTQFVERLPVRTIEAGGKTGRGRHDRMVACVDRMLALHQQLDATKRDRDRELLQRQIDATDREIDQLVYRLYGLTDAEIRIVEEATSD